MSEAEQADLIVENAMLNAAVADAAKTIDRLSGYLYAVGICSACGAEFEHDVTEPFARCPKGCWQGEDTVGPPLLQRLRQQLR